MKAVVVVVVAVVAVVTAACGAQPAKDVGALLFRDARTSGSEVNKFSCATCHGDNGAAGDNPALIHAGFDLSQAALRTRYWGGYAPTMLDATNACLTFFMRGAPLAKDDPKARALYEYLASLPSSSSSSSHTAPDLPLTIVENVTTVARGSKSKGAAVWDNACRVCHGDPHTGNGRLTETASLVPEASIEFGKQIHFSADLVVIEKIRHGAFFGVGGTMPPFSKEQLSDDNVGALVAFLGL